MSGGGWVPCQADWWEAVAAALTASGQPWPEEAILMDLRWWDDRERWSGGRKPRPGRAALQARWNATERPARRLMADVEAWRDPSQGDLRPGREAPRAPQRRPVAAPAAPTQGPGDAPPVPQQGPADVPNSGPEHRAAQEGCPAKAQARPQQGPSEAQARPQQGPAKAPAPPSERPHAKNTHSPPPSPPPPHTHPAAEAPGGARGSVCVEELPGWLRVAAAAGKVEPRALGLALVAAAAAVTGRPTEPEWGGLPGKGSTLMLREATLTPPLRLWRALEYPPLDAWLAEVRAVARCAREHRDPTFARWIRGEGTTFGNRADRMTAVMAVERWPERAELACAAPSAPAPLRLVEPEPAGDAGLDSMVQLLSEQVGTAATAELLAAATAAHLSQADIMGLLIKICTGRRQSEAVEVEIDRLRSGARAAR